MSAEIEAIGVIRRGLERLSPRMRRANKRVRDLRPVSSLPSGWSPPEDLVEAVRKAYEEEVNKG